MLTRKHYNAIAENLERQYSLLNGNERVTFRQIVRDLLPTLASFNPNFDRSRFLSACGISEVDNEES